jgi:ATP-dependent protease HslVU (ClpYQ) peptidase subunit
MKDMQEQLQKLLAQASECASIASSATDHKKRELFERLAEHYRVLAGEVQRAIAEASLPKP